MRILIFGCLCLSTLAACAGLDADRAASFTVVDSAGIQILTSTAPAWGSQQAWQVSLESELTIGTIIGSPETAFGSIAAVGWLPDGRIYVGDDQALAIRVFTPGGQYQQTIGGEGQGPGEFQSFLTIGGYRGDSLFVYDYVQRIVNIVGPDLTFARRFQNPVFAGNYWVIGSLQDGTLCDCQSWGAATARCTWTCTGHVTRHPCRARRVLD